MDLVPTVERIREIARALVRAIFTRALEAVTGSLRGDGPWYQRATPAEETAVEATVLDPHTVNVWEFRRDGIERKPRELIQGRWPAIELTMGDGSTSGSQDVTFDVFEVSWVDGFLVDHMQPQRTGSSQSQNSRLG